MRLRLPLAFLFLCCCLVATAPAQTPEDPLTKKVDQLFATWDKPDSPGAAIAVIKDGAVVYKHGYGSANLEYNIPITPQTVFHVASVSKQFTAFSIVLLANQGKLSLDDDIRKHLPEVPDFGKKITIRPHRHLLRIKRTQIAQRHHAKPLIGKPDSKATVSRIATCVSDRIQSAIRINCQSERVGKRGSRTFISLISSRPSRRSQPLPNEHQ